jgi:uncharacterized protein (DUF924 family)
MSIPAPETVLAFWFDELSETDWFRRSDEVDADIKGRFQLLHNMAAQGELGEWRRTIRGRLAEIILLDQFPRNIYRNSPRSFETDAMALVLSQEALRQTDLDELNGAEKAFLLMPYMHSESKVIHEQAVILYDEPGMENNLDFEKQHKLIIDQFGRYPHRNEMLGRESTPEEITYLSDGSSGF